jgi:tricorn protease
MLRVRLVTALFYLRHPHLARNLLSFVAEDDVWLADLDEAVAGTAAARRITADRSQVLSPRLNPSGTHVAWSAIREGAREAYAVEVDGGPISRLTYWGERGRETAGVRGWLSDGEVLVTGWNGHHEGMRVYPFAVPLDGPERALPYGPVSDVSLSPEGAVLVGSAIYREPARWKHYRGGTGGKIWYSPDGGDYRQILGEVGNHLVNPMWVSGRVAFLSDHDGAGALYSARPDGSDLRRHTEHGPSYARNAASDGTRVVYQCAGELWLVESLDAEPVPLRVRLGGVRSGRAPLAVTGRAGLGGYALCRTGRVVAAEVRGTAHWLPAEDGPARALLAEPGVRARLPLILPGTSTVVCASDADGEDGIDIIPADGSPARRILSGEVGRVLELAASPDARTLALCCDDGRLLIVDLASGRARELARSRNHEPYGLTFSPDSALLAWAQLWRNWNGSHIRLARLADDTVVDVTAARFDDFSPAFTADGKYLAFLSNRTFDPVQESHSFDLSFVPGVRPYLVTLAAETPSPFAPELNGRPVRPKAQESAGRDEQDEDGAEPPVAPVRLDLEGLSARIVPFPVPAGHYRDLRAAEKAVLWLEVPRVGQLGESLLPGEEHPKPRLLRYDLAKRKQTTAVEALDDYAVSGDGRRLAWRKDGALTIRESAGSGHGDGDEVAVDLDRIRITVDRPAEWRQMYAENWRLMRDNFWRADMGGVDWPAVRERYQPLLERIGTADDLRDVMWEVGAELGASHAYVRDLSQGSPIPAVYTQGRLGADLERTESGAWRIARIVPSETSVAGGLSPLEAPGVAARAGDVIAAVDGQGVDPVRGPAPLLVGKAGKPVELTLRRDGEPERRVAVVPLADEGALRYQDLIRTRRETVHRLSGGRLGYLHVPDMSTPGWAEFHRDLITEIAHEGLVFDLRENGGGYTSELVIEKLRRQVIGWDLARRSEPGTYPADAPRGPIVALTDDCAGSDGDIGTHAFKRYGLGPVIGTRTWGGVIGIDGRYELVDGTSVTQPKYAFWFDDAGWSVENYGVEPDIELPIPPHDWAAGRDPQLAEAVRTALAALEEHPAVAPPELPPVG